jgi:hypothetical protein
VFLGLDLEHATNWTDLRRAVRILAGMEAKEFESTFRREKI